VSEPVLVLIMLPVFHLIHDSSWVRLSEVARGLGQNHSVTSTLAFNFHLHAKAMLALLMLPS
jgi:hypothetical protein